MKPYYEEGGIRIYHGDCREVMASIESVDLIVTDPPFFMPAQISQYRKPWPRTLADFGVMAGYYRDVFADCAAKLCASGAFYTFCDSSSYAVFFSVIYPLFVRTQCVVWSKEVGGLGNGWRHSHELILHGALAGTVY